MNVAGFCGYLNFVVVVVITIKFCRSLLCMSCEQRRKTLRSYISLEEPRTKDTMEDFLKQMVAIEQSRVDRDDKRVEKEAIARKQDKAQMAEQCETDKRMMAEQHDQFMQLLQEVQIPHKRNPPPPPAHRLHIKFFARNQTIWQLT